MHDLSNTDSAPLSVDACSVKERQPVDPIRRRFYFVCLCISVSAAAVIAILIVLFWGSDNSGNCSSDEYWFQTNMDNISQWNQNHGYCGESSFISTGLSLGQYYSQYDARDIASRLYPTANPQVDGELLLGYNDNFTASMMGFNFTSWDNSIRSTDMFLVWVKERVQQGYFVTVGVYTNEYMFYCDTNKRSGDSDYDHIVSVVGIDSAHNLASDKGVYYPDDVLYFSDHGLWNPSPNITGPRYVFNYTFAEVQANREEANSQRDGASVYYLPSDVDVGNYGIAVSGLLDFDNTLLPVRVESSANYELPEIEEGSSERPEAMDLTLTITVGNLQPGNRYVLYKYSDVETVPTRDFNANANLATRNWNISLSPASNSSEYSVTDAIWSCDQAIYRAVSVFAA